MTIGAVDRIRITTVVDNYIDNLRQDDAVARRYSAFVAGKMPDLRAEHGLSHLVEITRGGDRFTMAFDFGLTPETLNHNFRELALDPASIDAGSRASSRKLWFSVSGVRPKSKAMVKRSPPRVISTRCERPCSARRSGIFPATNALYRRATASSWRRLSM